MSLLNPFSINPNWTEHNQTKPNVWHSENPRGSWRELRATVVFDQKDSFVDQAKHRSDKFLKNLDRASIVGIKYESAMILFAEVLFVTIISPSRLSRSFEKGHWGFYRSNVWAALRSVRKSDGESYHGEKRLGLSFPRQAISSSNESFPLPPVYRWRHLWREVRVHLMEEQNDAELLGPRARKLPYLRLSSYRPIRVTFGRYSSNSYSRWSSRGRGRIVATREAQTEKEGLPGVSASYRL